MTFLGSVLSCRGRRAAAHRIGGIAETQEVIDYCAARSIKADIELIRPDGSTGPTIGS